MTLDAGIRWEYGAPITELYNRLVNLDVAPGFAAVAPVVASDPVGSLTGHRYPNSLIRADASGVEPRIGERLIRFWQSGVILNVDPNSPFRFLPGMLFSRSDSENQNG